MAERAALITGASGGIGLAIATVLAEEGYGLTLSARRPDKLEDAVAHLREAGHEVETVAANVADEDQLKAVFTAHEARFGRLDVLVNNAGVGIGAPMAEIQTKFLDMQLAVNLRSIILGTREGLPLLRKAGAEHGKALIVNTASITGKTGQPWLSIYGATKAAVLNFSVACEREVGAEGIACTAFAPAFVDTAMTDFVKESVPAEAMIQPGDIGEAVRFLLKVSPNCHIPEIVFTRAGEIDGAP
ncbi:MAG TPA: SDR family oxidoreductase [Solirubrobacterales bacterium]|nr:SDR family oxidoreductase [Solirubrobacterales bacterium]